MSDIQAALLVNQIDLLDDLHEKRVDIAKRYDFVFGGNSNIKTLKIREQVKHAYHLYTVLVDSRLRDEQLYRLHERGIGVSVHYKPIHLMSYYMKKYNFAEGDFANTEAIASSTFSLPFYPSITEKEVSRVIETVTDVIGNKSLAL